MAYTKSKSQVNIRDRLSQWDSRLAPLSDHQKDGFVQLSSSASFRHIPSHLPVGEIHEVGKREIIKVNNCIDHSHLDQLNTSQQFLAWFDEVERHVQVEQEKCYRDYSGQLQEYQDQCVTMLTELGKALEFLQEMKRRHQFVSQRTGALHQACEQLVEEETKLVNVAESISNKLSYFTELERVGSRLNSSTLSVTSDSFVATLARLDECISFIEKNPHYKESQVYLARFKQFLSRALNLVKQHVVSTLKTTTKAVLPKLDKPGTPTTSDPTPENSYAQYYGKFRTSAPKIKALMKEIEQRTEKATEYKTLLHDCHQCYVSQRGQLLTPTVMATIEHIKKVHGTDNCGLVRAGCNFLCRVCQDEYHLFFHFFSQDSSHLNGLLESLCYSLYDTLRPVIIHTNHLETLADLCTIFKVEMLEERVEPKGCELAAFGGVVRQMLEDVQQRIVFRAQRYIQTDIRGYNPASGDLAYPDKLIVANEATIQDETISDSDSVFDTSGTESDVPSVGGGDLKKAPPQRRRNKGKRTAAADMHAMWYPTVRRTLLCLSKLYRCIEKPVFEGIAHEALSECMRSLQSASDSIKSKKKPVDAQLFLIKHLLILREQIAAFDVDFAVKEVSLDWTRTKAAAYGLLKKRSRLFSLSGSNAVLEFFLEGVPDVIERHLDSKKEVDLQLKSVCEKFISDSSSSLLKPLKELLARFDVIFQLASKDSQDPAKLLHHQPFAKPSELHKVVNETNKLLKAKTPELKKSLSLYLASEETEHILFRPCRASVLQAFESLEKVVVQYYSTEDQYIISCPTQDQVSLMLTLQSC